uniref:Predicted homoserine dehydrogenase n=1 Tax=uncultured Chloroflexi bacterium HF0500_03M05 TaxID=710737 RepID=E0XY75_9CHLR|nr:predicted homoserine dehydrogenase [uncultured Chloroflexi bacterium HF0500_03M05]
MRDRLMALDETEQPIRVAIIGCGRFGSMMMTQIMRAPGMNVAIVCDLNLQRVIDTFRSNDHDLEGLTVTNRVSEANDGIRRQEPVLTEDVDVAIHSDVDVVVEATGNPNAGAIHASAAIAARKHIVMVNVETDVLVGPVLKHMADKAGVVYSLAYGDQPAVIDELYDWATCLGFEVIAAGKGTKYLPEYRRGTPDQALRRYGYTPEEVGGEDLNPQMYNSFLDGTKSAVEMCAVANMTGLVPDVPGMHFPPASVNDLPALLIPAKEGGILSKNGVVEVVSCIRRDGVDIPNSLRWGVFVVLTTDSLYLRNCLREYGVAMDPSGRYGVMYRPYHLVGMEAPISIARIFLHKEPTGAPKARVGEVVAVAKHFLKPGDVLDGEGGCTVYGSLVEAVQASSQELVPIGLCSGARVVRPINADQMLSYQDVEMLEGMFVRNLRESYESTD